ncbi:MAG: bifunctional phosphoribosylaminoimidazolecarboxamide formyltransferase/IMP cyclohydrolase [Chitinophagales bacterium]|nr:bifunctional phosphoribosylaminoimidazolecarboxamide formyltransferase/IMP cyclohydrolase [Chitinophagales bacterium]
MDEVKIKTALISVYHKDGLEPVVKKLYESGVQIISTGGTASFIKSLNVLVTEVEELTHFPEILGGRVKTLHPKIFGGILGRRELSDDVHQMHEHMIPQIDLVIVDLYPFETTVASTTDEFTIIEKIDIGGIALIRAAAKNFNDVLVCPSREEYENLFMLLEEKSGITSKEDRQLFAAKAFAVSSSYDTLIFNYFNRAGKITTFKKSINHFKNLRYGENPHQKGIFYGETDLLYEQLNGKELSYNNLADIDAAFDLIDEFKVPACAIIKHTNACGVAEAEDVVEAWNKALAADPVSAFGGIIIFNQRIIEALAGKINGIFFEIIIASGYDEGALQILRQKKNRIILLRKEVTKNQGNETGNKVFKSLLNGIIEQSRDELLSSEETLKIVTQNHPSKNQVTDLLFAEKCVKHLKSNAIAIVKGKQLIGMGCGQTSRIDALKQAIARAKAFHLDLKDSVLASDAFFPFNDWVELAHAEGINAILQPGGSIRDQDSINLCNEYQMPMVFTGLRHFRH